MASNFTSLLSARSQGVSVQGLMVYKNIPAFNYPKQFFGFHFTKFKISFTNCFGFSGILLILLLPTGV